MPVVVGNQSNGNAGTKVCNDAGKARMETVPSKDYILLPMWPADPLFSQNSKESPDAGFKPSGEEEKIDTKDPGNENEDSEKDSEVPSTKEPREDQRVNQELDASINSTNNINTASDGNNTNNVNAVSLTVNAAITEVNVVDQKTSIELLNDLNMPELEDIVSSYDDADVSLEADMNNLDAFMPVRYTQEEGIDYDEVFAPVARIEAIRLFLAYALIKDFVVYQMDVKSDFIYGKIEEEVYVCQPPGFEDPSFLDKVYVDDIIFRSTNKKLCIEFEKITHKKFQMSSMGKLTFFLGLQVKQKKDGIFISQNKYVTEILKKFSFSDVKTASIPMETHKPLLKDTNGKDVDEHMYRSMIGSLIYLTSSRPDIMFDVCVCARFHVNPKISHIYAVKRIFRYLKGQPKLDLWYPKDSPFDLVAYTDSDYAGASLDKKSTTGGCQFLGCRLISWQCKKQTVVANSTTEVEYVAASSCCGQFWSTAKIKTLNNETQIHAKVEGKTIVLSESSVRRDIQFNDEDDMGEGSGYPTDPQHTSTSAQPSNEEPITVPSPSQPKKTHRPRKAKRATEISQSSGPIPLVADETITKEREYIMERAATTASSLEAEELVQVVVLGAKIPYWGIQKLKWLVERLTSKQSNDPPLLRVNTLRSGENRLKLKELMNLCTKLFDRVLDLETTKTAQAKEIASLKKRVKKLERKRKSKTTGMNLFKIGTSRRRSLGEEDASKQERNLKQSSIFKESDFNEEFDANMDKAIEQVYDANTDTVEEGEFQVPTTNMEVNTASTSVTAASINITTVSAPVTTVGISVNPAEPITTASKVVTTAEPSTPPTTTTTIFEDEDLTIAQTLVKMRSGRSKMKAELEEEERLARERKEDANIAESDDVQAMMDADYELAADVQHTSRE
ncbi:putative ribonuclease H-like domain-containing protein [Tanacetum coccineum]